MSPGAADAALAIQIGVIAFVFFAVPVALWFMPKPVRRWLGE